MTKEEYLQALREGLQNANIEDVEEIVKKYENRFALAAEAGFEEADIMGIMDKIDDVVAKYSSTPKTAPDIVEEPKSKYNLRIDSAYISDITFVNVDYNGLKYEMDEDLYEVLHIDENDHELIISGKKSKFLRRRGSGDITIFIGKNVIFNRFELALTATDVSGGRIVTNQFSLSTVSGDIEFEKIECKTANITCVSGDIDVLDFIANDASLKSVSGDIELGNAIIKNASASSVSGDITLSGKIESIKGKTVSGEITYNKSRCVKNLSEEISSSLKNISKKWSIMDEDDDDDDDDE